MAISLNALRSMDGASTRDDLVDRVSRLLGRAGVEFWVYGLNLPLLNDRRRQFTLTNYPAPWVEHYVASGYMHVDPIVAHCHSFGTPFLWSDAQARAGWSIDLNQVRIRRLFDEAAAFGMGAGVTIPLHGPGQCWGLMSFVGDRAHRPHLEQRLADLALIANFLHEAARPFAQGSTVAVLAPSLTRRERECLHWVAEGKTSWETGQVLGVAERTVIFHLANAVRKLGVRGRQAAVARAVSLGVIAPC